MNMETVLRLAFAEPAISGVYLSGLAAEELIEPNAALIDAAGEPTAAGLALDGLFSKLWWSNETGVTDERGNVQSRVFTGWYTVKATLPNGKAIEAEVYIPKSDQPKFIVLQATAVEQ